MVTESAFSELYVQIDSVSLTVIRQSFSVCQGQPSIRDPELHINVDEPLKNPYSV